MVPLVDAHRDVDVVVVDSKACLDVADSTALPRPLQPPLHLIEAGVDCTHFDRRRFAVGGTGGERSEDGGNAKNVEEEEKKDVQEGVQEVVVGFMGRLDSTKDPEVFVHAAGYFMQMHPHGLRCPRDSHTNGGGSDPNPNEHSDTSDASVVDGQRQPRYMVHFDMVGNGIFKGALHGLAESLALPPRPAKQHQQRHPDTGQSGGHKTTATATVLADGSSIIDSSSSSPSSPSLSSSPSLPSSPSFVSPRHSFTFHDATDDPAGTLARFDIFVHSGPQDTASYVMREAMATGIPVIGMRTNSAARALIHENDDDDGERDGDGEEAGRQQRPQRRQWSHRRNGVLVGLNTDGLPPANSGNSGEEGHSRVSRLGWSLALKLGSVLCEGRGSWEAMGGAGRALMKARYSLRTFVDRHARLYRRIHFHRRRQQGRTSGGNSGGGGGRGGGKGEGGGAGGFSDNDRRGDTAAFEDTSPGADATPLRKTDDKASAIVDLDLAATGCSAHFIEEIPTGNASRMSDAHSGVSKTGGAVVARPMELHIRYPDTNRMAERATALHGGPLNDRNISNGIYPFFGTAAGLGAAAGSAGTAAPSGGEDAGTGGGGRGGAMASWVWRSVQSFCRRHLANDLTSGTGSSDAVVENEDRCRCAGSGSLQVFRLFRRCLSSARALGALPGRDRGAKAFAQDFESWEEFRTFCEREEGGQAPV